MAGKVFSDKIILTKVYNGEDSTSYKVSSNNQKIVKFYEKNSEGEKIVFSPPTLSLQVLNDDEVLDYIITKEEIKDEAKGTTSSVIRESYKLTIYYFKDSQWIEWPKEEVIEDNIPRTKQVFFDYNENEETWNLNIEGLLEKVEKGELENEEIKVLASVLKTSETFLKISLSIPGQIASDYPVEITWGTPEEMAKFNVTATTINALVGENKLAFDASGLTIVNGGFKIINEQEETILGVNPETGRFFVKGRIEAEEGYFKGRIEAEEGTFKGRIEADSGSLKDLELTGELTIGNNFFIRGKAKDSSNEEPYDVISSDNFIVDSKGYITANQINLGTGAKIADFLQLGKAEEESEKRAFLYNPDNHNGRVFSTGLKDKKHCLDITNEGKLIFGNNMIIDGTDDSISSGLYISSAGAAGWRLDNNTAYLNNAVIRGSIKSAVMEYGEVQTIGGIIVIRPSSIIKEAIKEGSNFKIVLEETQGFNAGDYCEVPLNMDGSALRFKISEILEDQNTIKLTPLEENIEENEVNLIGKTIINYGKNTDSTAIAINSSKNDSYCLPQSISIFEVDLRETIGEENNNDFFGKTNKLILGRLPNISDFSSLYIPGSYGLYADNVLLKGSLISVTGGKVSAISSSSGMTMPKPDGVQNDWISGEVFIWAGQPVQSSDSTESIDEGSEMTQTNTTTYPFMVDSNGNFYASNGYFKGSILTEATIEAAKIKTAEIIGTGKIVDPNSCGLVIKNVNEAIHFKDSDENTIMVLKSDEEGMILNTNLNVNGKATINHVSSNKIETPNLKLLSKENKYPIIEFDEVSKIQLKENNLEFLINEDKKISISKDTTEFHNEDVWLSKNILFGEKEERKFEYRPYYNNNVLSGYDLYVR